MDSYCVDSYLNHFIVNYSGVLYRKYEFNYEVKGASYLYKGIAF